MHDEDVQEKPSSPILVQSSPEGSESGPSPMLAAFSRGSDAMHGPPWEEKGMRGSRGGRKRIAVEGPRRHVPGKGKPTPHLSFCDTSHDTREKQMKGKANYSNEKLCKIG